MYSISMDNRLLFFFFVLSCWFNPSVDIFLALRRGNILRHIFFLPLCILLGTYWLI